MKRKIFVFLAAVVANATICSFKVQAAQISPSNNTIKLQFPVISDTHIGLDSSQERLANALNQYNQVAPNYDAIAMVGDITTTGYISQYDAFMNIVNRNVHYGAQKIITMGNHEYFAGIYDTNSGLTDGILKYRFVQKTGMPGVYYDKWVKGYHFIALTGEQSTISNKNAGDNAIISDTQYAWLEKALAQKASSNKPIFVFLHQPIDYTTYGTEFWGGVNDNRLATILKKYPQVILFSGHTHNLVDHPRTVYQNGFTMVNDGSVEYTWYNCDAGPSIDSQGLLVNVYDNKVEIKSREFSTGKWLKTFTVSVPFKKTIFDDIKPKFNVGSTVKASNVTGTSATLTFMKASDNTQIDGYVIKNNGQIIKTDYLKYWENNLSNYYSTNISGLCANTTYNLEVYAMDAWNNTSLSPIKVTFKTGKAYGWVQSNGNWLYYDLKTGNKKTGWLLDKNKWYYLDKNGIMKTGWIKDTDGKWYYLEGSGAMKTGWLSDGSNWYYLDNSGAMKTGWFKDTNGKWYYLSNNGAMKTGWFKDTDGKWYYLDSSGAMKTGWIKVNGTWYYMDQSGAWVA